MFSTATDSERTQSLFFICIVYKVSYMSLINSQMQAIEAHKQELNDHTRQQAYIIVNIEVTALSPAM